MEKLASILIPTRGRFNELLKAIKSIIDATNNLDRIEIILRFDDDDKSSLDRLGELPKNIDINVMVGKRYGYVELHKYVNEMCAETKGEFIAWFNDDCIIESKNWDNIVAQYTGKIVCFYPNNKGTGSGNIFPIISRKIYEILGHFSLAQQVDSWHHYVGKIAGIEVYRDDLVFIHNRKQEYISDENRGETLEKNRIIWESLDSEIIKDAAKIARYIKSKGK